MEYYYQYEKYNPLGNKNLRKSWIDTVFKYILNIYSFNIYI